MPPFSMAGQELVTLRAGRLEAVLAPAVGGCLAAFDFLDSDVRVPVLRGEPRVPARVLDAASFPLVPFVNRVRGGAFSFRGREISMAPNMPPDPSPLHGQGWLNAWQVTDLSEAAAELRFQHSAGEWPWDYEAVQRVAMDSDGLALAMGCTNLSSEPMPCGLGQHPYFPCTGATRLDTGVRWAWTIDDKVLPVERVPAEDRYDLRDRLVCGQGLDHGFGGWSGRARIASSDLPFDIEMSSADAGYFQLYSPPEGGLFVAEPVSHANAALNAPEESWAELGLKVLEPGETMTLSMRIDVLAPWNGAPAPIH
jgi:aldose 1-epimerase